jgi:hypothetical protein
MGQLVRRRYRMPNTRPGSRPPPRPGAWRCTTIGALRCRTRRTCTNLVEQTPTQASRPPGSPRSRAGIVVSELLINKAAWQKLPKDLQSIVENAAAACNVISEGWCQRNNSEAMEDLIRNQKVVARPLPDAVIKALREETEKVLAEAIAKDPLTRKVHESYFAFKAKFDRWSEISEEQYHVKVRG